jgi:hypothetical protein
MTTEHFKGYPLKYDHRTRYPYLPVVTVVVTIGVLSAFFIFALWMGGL